MTKEEYKEYLKTDDWKEKRQSKFHECNRWGCQICHDKTDLDVHHINYKNIFDVTNEDLILICRGCHIIVHELIKLNIIAFLPDETSKQKFIKTKKEVLKFINFNPEKVNNIKEKAIEEVKNYKIKRNLYKRQKIKELAIQHSKEKREEKKNKIFNIKK